MLFSDRNKELISVGASIAAGCKMCVEVHVREARRCGASDEEIERAMRDAASVRRSAQQIMERHGIKVLGRRLLGLESGSDDDGASVAEVTPTKLGELVAVAAAFAVNCETNLDAHAAAARERGASEKEINAVLKISRFIKGKADSLCCKWV